MEFILLFVQAALFIACDGQEELPAVDIPTLLSDGDKLINLNNETQLIAFMGSTGTGKSTLLKFVSHDESLVVERIGRNFVYSDSGQTISSKTQVSKTLLPNIRRDLKKGVVLADCPGFSDTRSAQLEIATTYFNKKVLESAKQIKIILVENHFSLIGGNDRSGFPNLLEHVAKLIPDIEYFRGSIGLVATKVDGTLPDEEEIDYILKYINETNQFLENKLQGHFNHSQQELKLWERMAKVSNIILGDFSGKNIALFRRPDKVGSPWKSDAILNNYQSLHKFVFETTLFAKNEGGIFKYAVSPKSLLLVKGEWLGLYEESAAKYFQSFTNEFEGSFLKRIEQITNINSKLDFINYLSNMINTFKENINFLHNLPDFCHDLLKEIRTQIYKPNLKFDLATAIKQAEFLYNVADESFDPIILKLKRIFTNQIVLTVENYHFLYKYMEVVKRGLQQFDIQMKRSIYYSNLRHFMDESRFRELILGISDIKIDTSLTTSVLSAKIPKQFVAEMRELLTENLNYTVNINMIGSELFIEGHNLIFSEVKSILGNHSNYSEVNLFAFNNIFIDDDLLLKDAHVNIIAPYIHVSKQAQITLVGRKIDDYTKAQKSNSRTKSGNDGRAGIPGANAGNILIASLKIFHHERLTISNLGAQGGKGEGGGDGYDGKASGIPGINDIEGYGYDLFPKIKSMGYDYVEGDTDIPNAIPIPALIVTTVTTFDAFILGVNNTQGNVLPTKGGDGGVGGIGGNSGNIKIITKQYTSIKTVKRNGSPGLPGSGGKGGKGEASCALRILYCEGKTTVAIVLLVPVLVQKTFYYYCIPRTNEKCYSHFCSIGNFCEKHQDGKDGITGNSLFLQENKKTVDSIKFKDILHFYKSFTLSNNLYKYHQEFHQFIDFFQNEGDILKSYSPIEYIKDVILIESKLSFSIENLEQLRFYFGNMYESFVSAKRYGYVKNSIESYLIEMALISKLEDIRSLQENKIIIDIGGYITQRLSVIAQIKSDSLIILLHDRSEAHLKKIVKTIEENQLSLENEFEKRLLKKIEEADKSIENMSNELFELRKVHIENIKNLSHIQHQLHTNIQNRAIFGTVNFFKSIIDVFIPAAGAAIGVIVDIAEHNVIQAVDVRKETTVRNIAQGIEFGNKVLRDVTSNSISSLKSKARMYNNIVMKLKSFVSKNNNKLNSTVSTVLRDITNISNTLQNYDFEKNKDILNAAVTVDEIFSQTNNIISLIQDEFSTNFITDEILIEFDDIKKYASLVPKLSRSVVSTLQKYENDEQKLKLVYEAIEKNGDMIKELNKYEQSLFQFIQPLFNNLTDTLKQFSNNLSGKTYFLVQFQKLNIKSHLKEVYTFVSKLTQGLETGEDLTQILTELEDLIYTVIDAYDKINELEYKHQLAKFITIANSQDFRNTVIENANYSALFANVIKLISSNILIAEYNSIFQAYKQHAFPFINYFINYLNFDTIDLGNEKRLMDKALIVMNGINTINKKVSDMKTQIIEGTDRIIHIAEFYSQSALKSFFTWYGKEHNKMIRNFLRGDQITLLADVKNVQHLNAVKFRKLKLNITCNENSLNTDLHHQLRALQVEMKHFGESHYKCDLKYFSIKGNSFTITHSFDTNKHGIPTSRNSVYDKIIAGDISLSPYTLWKFQLKPLPGHSLPNLSRYFGQVDLELVGTGQYISEGSEICALPLEMYYDILK